MISRISNLIFSVLHVLFTQWTFTKEWMTESPELGNSTHNHKGLYLAEIPNGIQDKNLEKLGSAFASLHLREQA